MTGPAGPRRPAAVRARVVRAIVTKDLQTFARDRFYLLVSVLGLAFYVVVFWLLPATVDEAVEVGVHFEGAPVELVNLLGEEGLVLEAFATPEQLEAAVAADLEIAAGLDFPADFVEALARGEAPTVRVLLRADRAAVLGPALSGLVRELGFVLAGDGFPVTPPSLDELVVGEDRTGAQVSLRERMRPLFVFAVLLVEMLALATLVAAEIGQRTISAVLVTPARVSDVLFAKTLLGTLLAFVQAMLLLTALGSLTTAPVLLAATLLLGGVLVTGFGLLAGAVGRDFVGVMFTGLAFLVPLATPAIDALLPGSSAAWIRALPTYGLVQIIVGATSYGAGWSESAGHLGALALWCVASLALGIVVLTRRVARL